MSKRPAQHPTSFAQYVAAHKRWQALKAAHQQAADLMWAGVLATQFSEHELKLLSVHHALCVRDHQLLKQAGKPLEMSPELKRMWER